MSNETSAIRALEKLGLTEYEARCFVALSRISQGTAKDISQVSEIPRSRVYDTVERLHRRGLVDVQQSEPRQFRVLSKDDALDTLRREYNSDLETADEALADVGSAETHEDRGVWAIANADHVSDRMVTLIDDADDRIHFLVADQTALERECLDRLAAASDRGVAIAVEVPSESARDRVREAIPDAHIEVQESLQESEKVVRKWPGQLILVDRQAALVSGIENDDLPDVQAETAMWTHGRDHGFAAWLPELLDDRVASPPQS